LAPTTPAPLLNQRHRRLVCPDLPAAERKTPRSRWTVHVEQLTVRQSRRRNILLRPPRSPSYRPASSQKTTNNRNRQNHVADTGPSAALTTHSQEPPADTATAFHLPAGHRDSQRQARQLRRFPHSARDHPTVPAAGQDFLRGSRATTTRLRSSLKRRATYRTTLLPSAHPCRASVLATIEVFSAVVPPRRAARSPGTISRFALIRSCGTAEPLTMASVANPHVGPRHGKTPPEPPSHSTTCAPWRAHDCAHGDGRRRRRAFAEARPRPDAYRDGNCVSRVGRANNPGQTARGRSLDRLPAPAVVVLAHDRLAVASNSTYPVVSVAAVFARLIAPP
jgi:hypothetical protein